ncbi:MAG: UvrD-helicase domain-containing protein, partial [Tumebacillaceae bacterium]
MADPRPTKNQWKAIRELDKHLTVSAGAGAGKTWVLTERYTTMLAGKPLVLPPEEWEAQEATRPAHEVSRPHQIVAITFTKEAAGEMKARIRGRLSKWKQQAKEQAASDEELRRIALLKEEVERATITTIHGYCSELLREYPLEAEVDPHFHVLEESAARLWLDESIREVLDEGLAASDVAVIRMVSEYGYEPLVRHLTRFYPSVREQTEEFAQMGADTLEKLGGLTVRLEPSVERLEMLLGNI